jgi:hypothetical protein
MFRRRLAGYNELGYRIELPQTGAPTWFGERPGEMVSTK